MFISVVMCTRNRSTSLERVLRSFRELKVPQNIDWEIVVVDNDSNDSTPQVVDSFMAFLPIRSVIEKKPGLSNARNCGVAFALGQYIIWTDDDVQVDPYWLQAYAEAFEKFPDGAVFGGRIIPLLEQPTPTWFLENVKLLQWVLAARDFGDDYLNLSVAEDLLPFGANFAVRAVEQRQFLYDPMLGVSPGKRRVGEEMKVIRSILDSGVPGYWVPGAKVHHIIGSGRQTISYVRDYFRGHGETSAYLSLSRKRRRRAELILHHGSRAFGNVVLFHGFKLVLTPRRWLPRLMNLGYHQGALNYALKNYADQDRDD